MSEWIVRQLLTICKLHQFLEVTRVSFSFISLLSLTNATLLLGVTDAVEENSFCMVEQWIGRDVILNMQHLVGVSSYLFTLPRRELFCCLWLLLFFFQIGTLRRMDSQRSFQLLMLKVMRLFLMAACKASRENVEAFVGGLTALRAVWKLWKWV